MSRVLFLLFLVPVFEVRSAGTFKTIQTGPKPIWNETHLDKLKKDLLTNYDKFLRPENHDRPTNVKISLTIKYVEADEKQSTLLVEANMKLIWTDSKLKWNKSDYGDLEVIRIADHEIWQPDIYLYNSVSNGEQLARVASKNVRVYSIGLIRWYPSIKFTAMCNFDLRHWPFDTQHCPLKFGSWVRSNREMALEINKNETSAKNYMLTIVAAPWDVSSTAVLQRTKYQCCEELYESVTYHLTLRRKSSPYYSIVISPAIGTKNVAAALWGLGNQKKSRMTTFLLLSQFWLPPFAKEKITLNCFAILILCIFTIYLNHQIVGVGPETPLIVLYYGYSLKLAALIMCGTVATYTVARVEKTKGLPSAIKALLEGRMGKFVLLELDGQQSRQSAQKRSIEEMKDHQLSEDSEGASGTSKNAEKSGAVDVQQEWVLLAVFCDRVLFVAFALVFLGLGIGLAV